MKGYVHLNVRAGEFSQVCKKLGELKELYNRIKEFDIVYGDFDVIVKIDTKDEREFIQTISEISMINEVLATATYKVATKEVVLEFLKKPA